MKLHFYATAAIILLAVGVYIGYRTFRPSAPPEEKITSEVIVSMLKQEGFLITQTYIFNQQVKIDKNSGNAIADFFWGQGITAFANMKVSSGVDLNKLTQADINITDSEINLTLPAIEIHSVELVGEITLQNKQGILKRIFDNADGYNEAYQTLQTEARQAAATTTLQIDAENSTKKEMAQLLQFVAKNRQISVMFKK